MAKWTDEQKAEAKAKSLAVKKPANVEPKVSGFSMDHEIGKGLGLAKESSPSESDYNKHPKFDKFKKEKG